MKFGTKIIVVAVLSILFAVIVGIFIQRSVLKEQGISLTHEKLRSTLLEAEDVRNSVSQTAEKSTFDYEKLRAELAGLDDYRESTLYLTISVVAGMNALEALAEKENLHFHVVRENSRNPEHAPSSFDSEILQRFERGETDFFQ